MPKRKRQTFKAATEFKVIKLKRSGPKPGTPAWAYAHAKQREHEELMDDPRTNFQDFL